LAVLLAGASFTSRALFSKKRRKNLTYAILQDRSERRTVEALETPFFKSDTSLPSLLVQDLGPESSFENCSIALRALDFKMS